MKKPARIQEDEAPLLGQQQALGAYLDALLAEAVPAPQVDAANAPVATPAPLAPVPESVQGPNPVSACLSQKDAANNGRPAWANGRFEVLRFQVAGLWLALPVDQVDAIITGTGGVTPLPDLPVPRLGIMPWRGGEARVIDTARVILPPDHVARLPENPAGRSEQLIIIGGGRWALACTRLGELLPLEPEWVTWRGPRGRRPWLAGTLDEPASALLDPPALIRSIEAEVA
ncbi:MAG TPA: chemotaxis protein CheW [Gammaproteobacteria bacterium]|nr:chemotaxis protein CheW [Gammaproteobacteria bacterium]